MKSEKTISKLKQVVQTGEIFQRRFQRYSMKTAEFTNCLFHAIFNLNNKQIESLNLDEDDKEVFKSFYKSGTQAQAIADIKNFVEQTGLRFETCDYDSKTNLGDNKVAIFFSDDLMNCDFHFFREEHLRNGKTIWSSKISFSSKVKKDNYLDMKMDGMSYYGCFKITNPNYQNHSHGKEKTR